MMRRIFGRMIAFVVAFVTVSTRLSAATDLAPPQSEETETCGVLFENASGGLENRVLSSLHIATLQADAAFSLPEDAPSNVKAVLCGRQSLAPLFNDYKVLIVGYTLNIIVDDRIGVLEISGGQLQFRMIDGKMTEEEAGAVQRFLNESQKFFYKPESLETTAASKSEDAP